MTTKLFDQMAAAREADEAALLENAYQHGERVLREVLATGGKIPPCTTCGKPITDADEAIVTKPALDQPSRIQCGSCFTEGVTRAYDIFSRPNGAANLRAIMQAGAR